MKIQIENGDHLIYQMEMANLKPGETLQTLCLTVADQAFHMEEDVTIVKIATSLIAASYLSNPAMFARSFAARCAYPHLQSFIRDGFLVVRAGRKKKINTFRGQVREGLENKGEYFTRKTLAPPSYRRRPSILSSALSLDLGQTVCNDYKKPFIRWFLKD